jgi:hypothetical protein
VDMIGPTLEVGNRTEKFCALTIIDLVTHLIEIVRVNNTTTATVAAHFGNAWFTRYPTRLDCYTVTTYNLVARQRRITSKCIHCVLRQCNPSRGLNDADALVDATLANAMYAMRSSFHSGLRTAPWSVSFSIATWL